MVNKVFLFCATLAFCVLLTNASIYELDEDEATNPIGPYGPRQRCQREFQQSRHLTACQRWIRRQMRRGSPRLEEDNEFDIENDVENPWGPPQQQQHMILQQCCNELRQEDPVCVCPTLKQAAKSVGFQGQHGPFQKRQIFQTAKHLPNICNIPQVGVCPFFPRSY